MIYDLRMGSEMTASSRYTAGLSPLTLTAFHGAGAGCSHHGQCRRLGVTVGRCSRRQLEPVQIRPEQRTSSAQLTTAHSSSQRATVYNRPASSKLKGIHSPASGPSSLKIGADMCNCASVHGSRRWVPGSDPV